jgi:hypothetical protein
VVRGRGEVEAPSVVAGPGLAGQGRVEGDDKLAGRVDGVGSKVEGHTVETMVGREGRARVWVGWKVWGADMVGWLDGWMDENF